jgi:hypothetical protein
MRAAIKYTLITTAIAILTACGGGGGGGGGGDTASVRPVVPPPQSIAGNDAWKNLLTSNKSYTLTGSDTSGTQHTMTLTTTNLGETFDAKDTYYTAEITAATATGNNSPDFDKTKLFVGKSDTRIRFLNWPLDSECLEVTNPEPVPQTVALNNTGNLVNGRILSLSGDRCNNVLSVKSYALTWSYEADGNTPLFCLNSTRRFLADVTDQTSLCFEVNQSGELGTKARFKQKELTLKNY